MNGDPEVTRYAVKVISGVALNIDKKVITNDGEEFWLCDGEWGVDGRHGYAGEMPVDVKTFKTRDEARHFASTWDPHPWYVKPKDWRIVEVKPRFVQCGWEGK